MEECSVLIETTKSAEDKISRWFDLPIDYELFRDLLGVEADSGDFILLIKSLSILFSACSTKILDFTDFAEQLISYIYLQNRVFWI